MTTLHTRDSTAKPVTDQDKELREQLHLEIEKKSKACSNPTYECTIPRLDGYDYCIRHILKDSRAPYRQCTYTFSNGKRCPQAAPKHDTKKDPSLTTYCFEHSRLAQLTKTRNTIGKLKHVETNEALLNNLSHHLAIEPTTPPSTFAACEVDEEIDVVSPNIRPFVNYDQIADLSTVNTMIRKKRRVLDYASDSSSDVEAITLNSTSKGHEWDNSDDESVDSQDEDLLKHAGIYTNEEAVAISRKKLITLQKLYIEQVNRLHHILKEKRRKYLHAIRKERETLCSIHDQPKQTATERKLYEKLKALNHYHRRHGIEAVLHKKFKEKRSKATEGYVHKNIPFPKCIFTEGGVKCGEKSMPGCKYCRKHILEDKKQILFRACGVEKSGIVCQEPVPNIFEDATCVLHINLLAKKQYIQKKYESETEEEEDDTTATGVVMKMHSSLSEISNVGLKVKEESDNKTADMPMEVDLVEEPNKNVTISHEEKPTDMVVKEISPSRECAPADNSASHVEATASLDEAEAS